MKATLVALGYLLLAPLLATANLQRQHSQALASSGGLRRASNQLQQMRQVLSSASSVSKLEQHMTALQGPRLDAADRSLPLPVLRSRMQDLLDQAAARLERARNATPPASPWTLLGDIVRTSMACLALAVGFAGLARRPGSELSLLNELQRGWKRFRYRRLSLRRGARRAGSSDEEYLRQLTEQEGAEDAEGAGRSQGVAGRAESNQRRCSVGGAALALPSASQGSLSQAAAEGCSGSGCRERGNGDKPAAGADRCCGESGGFRCASTGHGCLSNKRRSGARRQLERNRTHSGAIGW